MEEIDNNVTKAIVVADSFNRMFPPVTDNVPRTLLPLFKSRLIDYTLDMLIESGIKEIFIIACHHADKVRSYINSLDMNNSQSDISISVISTMSVDSCTFGDAIRVLDRSHRASFNSDFLILTGFIVANFNLRSVIKSHMRSRLLEKPSAVRAAQPAYECPIRVLFSRRRPDEMFDHFDTSYSYVLDVKRGVILAFNKFGSHTTSVKTEIDLFLTKKNEFDEIELHTDYFDSCVYICSPLILELFSEYFDCHSVYEMMAKFDTEEYLMSVNSGVKTGIAYTVLSEGCRIYNISSFSQYYNIHMDIICRSMFPLALEGFNYNVHNNFLYTHSKNCHFGRPKTIPKRVCIGFNSSVNDGSELADCVIGRHVYIGENVTIKRSIIMDYCVVSSGCVIEDSVVCYGCCIGENCVVKMNSVLNFDVVLSSNTIINGLRLSKMKSSKNDDDDNYNRYINNNFNSFRHQESVTSNVNFRPSMAFDQSNFCSNNTSFVNNWEINFHSEFSFEHHNETEGNKITIDSERYVQRNKCASLGKRYFSKLNHQHYFAGLDYNTEKKMRMNLNKRKHYDSYSADLLGQQSDESDDDANNVTNINRNFLNMFNFSMRQILSESFNVTNFDNSDYEDKTSSDCSEIECINYEASPSNNFSGANIKRKSSSKYINLTKEEKEMLIESHQERYIQFSSDILGIVTSFFSKNFYADPNKIDLYIELGVEDVLVELNSQKLAHNVSQKTYHYVLYISVLNFLCPEQEILKEESDSNLVNMFNKNIKPATHLLSRFDRNQKKFLSAIEKYFNILYNRNIDKRGLLEKVWMKVLHSFEKGGILDSGEIVDWYYEEQKKKKDDKMLLDRGVLQKIIEWLEQSSEDDNSEGEDEEEDEDE